MNIYERGARRHTRRIRLAAASGAGATALAGIVAVAVEPDRSPAAAATRATTVTRSELQARDVLDPARVTRSERRVALPRHRSPRHRSARQQHAPVRTVAVQTTVTAAPVGGVPWVWRQLAECESSGDWRDNTGNGYYGGVQEDLTFWSDYGGLRFAARPDLATPTEQVEVARRGLAAQGPNAWPVCGPRVGLVRGD